MSRSTVVDKWMVPSTGDKVERRSSPAGRVMQGRKGVGRFAASILGKDLLLETVTPDGEKTTVFIEWRDFEHAQYLDDVEVLIETEKSSEPSGTRLTITGDSRTVVEWNQQQFDKLRFELKKLISPVASSVGISNSNDRFEIALSIEGFSGSRNISEIIEPYPIFDLFDYRISGRIRPDGKGTLTFSLQKIRNAADDCIDFDAGAPTSCGELRFDIRVYDRDKESIESLIGRGLKDEFGNYVGKLQARQLLNEYNGIGVYRNGFRIRPLGDADFDWLKLNEQRVQNPSLRIGSNQVIGYVEIQSDEVSGLIEKSARDGLKDNVSFSRLKEIAKSVIAKLEERRFEYRRKAGLSRSVLKVERELEQLFSFDDLKRDIRKKLAHDGVDKQTSDQVIEIITRGQEDKNRVAHEISQAVAVYQGQATLGKIIYVILHEGRRPLSYFRNQIPNLKYWYELYLTSGDPEHLGHLVPIAEGIGQNAEFLVNLFSKLDPLAAGKRAEKRLVPLQETIRKVLSVFTEELKSNGITVEITGSENFKLLCWSQDMYSIFTNLVDNSIYWLRDKDASQRRISVSVVTDDKGLVHVDYRDTGTGIESSLIRSQVIFEPQFSTKADGTGLGLAIAGEAAERNGLELRALESERGAWFRLQPKSDEPA
jgi:signal transduction histidine kinase